MNSENTKAKRPRGNPRIAELGRATRFRPGQSGNPGGRPSRTPFADAYREVADLPVSELRISPTDSVAGAVAKSVSKEALKGKISAATEAANRAEGTPRQCPEVSEELAREVVIRYVTEKPNPREQAAEVLPTPKRRVSRPE